MAMFCSMASKSSLSLGLVKIVFHPRFKILALCLGLVKTPGGCGFFCILASKLVLCLGLVKTPWGCFAAWLQNFRFSLRLFCIVASIQYYCTLCLSIYPSDVVCRKIHSQLKRCRNPCMDTCHNSMVSLKEQCFVA